jgi:uncharacterized protein
MDAQLTTDDVSKVTATPSSLRNWLTSSNGFALPVEAFAAIPVRSLALLILLVTPAIALIYDTFINLHNGAYYAGTHRYAIQSHVVFLSYLIQVPLSFWLLCKFAKIPVSRIGLRRMHPLVFAAVMVLGSAAVIALQDGSSAILERFLGDYEQASQVALRHLRSGQILISCVTAIVLAPFVEEVVFRGIVFNTLYRRLPLWFAAAVSGCIFGRLHGPVVVAVPVAIGGTLLALIYARYRNLWLTMSIHATNNAFATMSVLHPWK